MAIKKHQVAIRLEEDVYRQLDDLANRRKLPIAAMARICLNDGLTGFDRRHENLLSKLEGLQHEVQGTAALTVTAIAAILLTEDNKDDNLDLAKAKLLDNLRNAVAVAKFIKDRLPAAP